MDLVTIADLAFPQNSMRAEKCEQILSKTCERPGELDLHWAERASAYLVWQVEQLRRRWHAGEYEARSQPCR